MEIMAKNIEGLSFNEVWGLVIEGHQLLCPVCGAILVTFPENLEPGQRPLIVECSVSQQHFYIHAENGKRREKMLELLRKMGEGGKSVAEDRKSES